MAAASVSSRWTRLLSDRGMVLVLLALCAYYSVVTFGEQDPEGASGGNALAAEVERQTAPGARVLIVVGQGEDNADFAAALRERLSGDRVVVHTVQGEPGDAREALAKVAAEGGRLDTIAATRATADWAVLDNVGRRFPRLGTVKVLTPQRYLWPTFLRPANLRNIANQNAVIAILAIGMTMVIVAGGIDLSVGSLVGLSAIVATWLIREAAGARDASALGMILCCLAAIAVCALMGLFSGVTVTAFAVPPFIVTLAVMLIARGLAYRVCDGQSINQVPGSFTRLGLGADFAHLPNAVLLAAVLYGVAYMVMAHTTLGRYIYAVGGNAEAARLSGVPVQRVLCLVYAIGGALAGLGGVILASQLSSGGPTYGETYELYVIAAAVVGGTSLAGGEGKVFGTLVGALIIAVIRNGMNLTSVKSETQLIVLGAVILGGVLLDRLKKRTWNIPKRFGRRGPLTAPQPPAADERIRV